MSKDGTEFLSSTVIPDGESGPELDAICGQARDSMQARCAVVVVIDSHAGSGYSVVGPFDSQLLLPDILEQVAKVLRQQLSKNLQ